MSRVAFIGAVQFSEQLVRALHAGPLDLVGICTTSQRFGSDALDLGPIAVELGVDTLDVQDINSAESRAWLEARSPDLIVCAGWSRLLGAQLLRLAPLGVLGYHPAALPRNRGRHPIIWTLALGLREAGSTFFIMDEGADSGPIVSQQTVPVLPGEDAGSLYIRLNEVAAAQLEDIAKEIARTGALTSSPQDHSRATYWRKRTVRDGSIDWRMSAVVIDRLVRALSPPYPGAEFSVDGVPVRILGSAVTDGPPDVEPGRVLDVRGPEATIMTGAGALSVRCDRTLDDLISPGDAL
jgi:methionyl-tRNA formyltransferase